MIQITLRLLFKFEYGGFELYILCQMQVCMVVSAFLSQSKSAYNV